MPSSYENWMAEIKKRADARAAENTTYQSEYNNWESGRLGAWGQFNQDQDAQRNQAWAAITQHPSRDGYQREKAAFLQQWKPGAFEYAAAPTPPPAQNIYKPGQGSPGAFRGNPTAKYGSDFLDKYGRDVLGMNPQMTSLQRMMNFTDQNYGSNDLSTGTQAARDYFAKSLTDWLREQRGGSGDFSALDESMDLQKMIKERLGLSYSNPDDLWAAVNQNYGYVNKPQALPTEQTLPAGQARLAAALPTEHARLPAALSTAPWLGPQRPDVGPPDKAGPPTKQGYPYFPVAPVIPGRPTGTNVMVNGRPIWRPSG